MHLSTKKRDKEKKEEEKKRNRSRSFVEITTECEIEFYTDYYLVFNIIVSF